MTSRLFPPEWSRAKHISRLSWQRVSAAAARLRSIRLIPLVTWVTLIGLMVAGYALTGSQVTLTINGHTQRRFTHQLTVEGLLKEADLNLNVNDVVSLPLDTRIARGLKVEVQLARWVILEADGQIIETYTQAQALGDLLAQVDVSMKPQDELMIDGQPQQMDQMLRAVAQDEEPDSASVPLNIRATSRPIFITVIRAVPVELSEGEENTTFYTTKLTVGEALYAQGIPVYLGDLVVPGLTETIEAGSHIHIERSTPVTISADGKTISTRTRGETVADVLAQEGLLLQGEDRVIPGLGTQIEENTTVQVIRVKEELKIDQEVTPFETTWVPADDMPIDSNEIVTPGQSGVTKTRRRLTYENGQETEVTVEDKWLDQVPMDKKVAYGTAVQVSTLETPDGPVEYWRHFRALATSYSAATSGKPKDHPRYGITRSGLPAGYGIIAVDPKVIPLGTQVYIPGYGVALAGDTGGMIIGRHVDLGFDEDDPPIWYRWVDVYMLAPVPPQDQIRYVLPNWPQEG